MRIELPALFNGTPPKLLPVLTDINRYKFVLLTGGRGGGKTEFLGRATEYWGEMKKLKVCCGRETLDSIEQSVHSTLSRIIAQYDLNYKITKSYIEHNVTGSKLIFKGFKEQGRANIKGLDDIDILWIDEAEQITEETLRIVMPTIRKDNAIVIFSMNRLHRNDAVYKRFASDPDCLHININYDENPSCPDVLKEEARKCKERDEKEFMHVWMGEPREQTDDYLFNVKKLDAMLTNVPYGDVLKHQRVIGFDYALQGNDLCAACVIDRLSPLHWKIIDIITWSDPDPDVVQGKILGIIAQYRPDLSVIDIGGMGYIPFANLTKTGLPVYAFDGSKAASDNYTYQNERAEGYYELKSWIDKGYLLLDPKFKKVIPEMEMIKFKYNGTTGRRQIQSKIDMKKDGYHSPDEVDSIMMAVRGCIHYLGKTDQADVMERGRIKRVSGRRR